MRQFVETGYAEFDRFMDKIGDDPGLDEMVNLYADLLDFAGRQQRASADLQPTACTLRALRLWDEAMQMTEELAQWFLALTGNGGDLDLQFDQATHARELGEKIGLALQELRRTCP